MHLPALPQQAAGRDVLMPSMALESMLKGMRAALGAIVKQQASAAAGRGPAKLPR